MLYKSWEQESLASAGKQGAEACRRAPRAFAPGLSTQVHSQIVTRLCTPPLFPPLFYALSPLLKHPPLVLRKQPTQSPCLLLHLLTTPRRPCFIVHPKYLLLSFFPFSSGFSTSERGVVGSEVRRVEVIVYCSDEESELAIGGRKGRKSVIPSSMGS